MQAKACADSLCEYVMNKLIDMIGQRVNLLINSLVHYNFSSRYTPVTCSTQHAVVFDVG